MDAYHCVYLNPLFCHCHKNHRLSVTTDSTSAEREEHRIMMRIIFYLHHTEWNQFTVYNKSNKYKIRFSNGAEKYTEDNPNSRLRFLSD